ncbi:hypothetical protein LCGC14_2289420 [marine sediment metagenome]|uniref:Uncharacterized protein n=1 Tax=marine sediment metagenome TaxID=412755 RepID=A0A0F9F472_9ZZZZ
MHTSYWLGFGTGIQLCWIIMWSSRLIFGRGVWSQLQLTWINLKIWSHKRLIRKLERESQLLKRKLIAIGVSPEEWE